MAANSLLLKVCGFGVSMVMKESGLSFLEKKDGCIDVFEDIYDPCLVRKNDLYGQECTAEFAAWQGFKYTCKHFNRYFDIGEHSSQRENLLRMLEIVFKSMNSVLDKNTSLLRARKSESGRYSRTLFPGT